MKFVCVSAFSIFRSVQLNVCMNERDEFDIAVQAHVLDDQAFISPMEPSHVKEDT